MSQLVIDIAGELSAREGHRFEDYSGAVRNLARIDGFGAGFVDELSRIDGRSRTYASTSSPQATRTLPRRSS